MRSRAHACFVAALLLLPACQGYVRSSAPLAPSAEVVRIPFRQPQVVVIARDDPAARLADTVDAVSSIEGTVIELRGDTLRLDVERFHRDGQWQRVPAGRHAVVDMSTARGVERRGFSLQQTAVQGTAVVALLALLAGLGFLLVISSWDDDK